MLPEALARELIAAHFKRPHHAHALPDAASAHLENPSCGDQVTVWVRLQGETLELSFEGKGCAISQASASMMTDLLRGQTRQRAGELSAAFRAMIMAQAPPSAELGELQALAGVSRLHARRKCALLAWRALDQALGGSEATQRAL
ncbi:Fe-S cluster assembly sulfur transfer protein SufU [Deinococcus sp.]|uniref:Fe-S cluster assembly sulfur transfer protein SufU n=1 Tax=Deinococcus sp. TaxID=47478 RepID=UPI003CC6046F